MITVNYLDGVDNIRCDEHLFQWDNGQKLCLSGLNTYVPNLETVDVHFCNKISKLAITVKPTVVSNNIVAPIPNSLLQDPYPIIAYFYVPSDNGSRTIVMVTIPIEPKKRPSDFILNEDEAIASLDAINNKVNTTLNNITVDYNNFKTNIEAELRDIVENLQLEDAKTLQSHPASDFVLKTELPSSLPANGGNADIARRVISPSSKVKLYENEEGGNLELVAPDGVHLMQMDLYNNENFRMYFYDGSQIYSPMDFNFSTGRFNINGNADTVDGLHANGFIKVNSSDAYDCNTLYDAGLYLCNGSATNTPNDLTYGSLFVMPYRHPYGNGVPDYCAQIFIPNGDTDDPSLWYRTSFENTWNEWKRSCDGGNADTLDGLHASSFALKTEIPTSLPANGGNADTVNSLKTDAPNYLDIFSTTLNSSHPCWNKKCSIYGQSNDINAEVYLANAPEINNAVWYEVETIGVSNRAYQIAHGCYSHQRKSFIRYNHDDIWSEWKNIADGGNADTANTANYATTAGNAGTVNGVKLLVGTREPQVEEPNALAYVPENAWYGQYT